MKAKLFGLLLFILTPLISIAQIEEASVESTSYLTAEENISPGDSVSNLLIGLSSFQWNQDFSVQENTLSISDTINYSGLILDIKKETIFEKWGWNIGGILGSGQAVAGGNNNAINYQKSDLTFTIWGISARIFYRLSGRISTGLSALGFSKDIDLPVDNLNQTVDAGSKLNAAALVDLNIRLFENWDFYSGLGPLKVKATVWKVGINYRF